MFKKIALACALIGCSSVAFASQNGWYLGLQAGYADSGYSNSDASDFVSNPLNASGAASPKTTDTGAVGRLFVGYKFNNYLAAEAGYSYFETYEFKNLYGVNGANADLQQQSGDLLIKPMLPLSDNFDLYAIAGPDYVHASPNLNNTAKAAGMDYKTQTAVRPEYGLGAEMYFKQYWSADLSWREFTSGGGVQSTQQAMIGIAYHFHSPGDEDY